MTASIADDIITETHDGNGGRWLVLNRAPIVEVRSLTIDGLEIPPSAGSHGAGYNVEGRDTLALIGYVFTQRPGSVVIRYRVARASGGTPTPGYSEKIRDWAIRTARDRPAGSVDGDDEIAQKFDDLQSAAFDACDELRAMIQAGSQDDPRAGKAYEMLRKALTEGTDDA